MSSKNLMRMRGNIERLDDTQVDGLVRSTWTTIVTGERCFLDLNFIRSGKDPVWVPDTGTAQNRSGVLFLLKNTIARPGDRIKVTLGPAGTFEIQSAVDEAWTATSKHHLECYVVEVNRTLANN